jgi:hypothetical protein
MPKSDSPTKVRWFNSPLSSPSNKIDSNSEEEKVAE